MVKAHHTTIIHSPNELWPRLTLEVDTSCRSREVFEAIELWALVLVPTLVVATAVCAGQSSSDRCWPCGIIEQ